MGADYLTPLKASRSASFAVFFSGAYGIESLARLFLLGGQLVFKSRASRSVGSACVTGILSPPPNCALFTFFAVL